MTMDIRLTFANSEDLTTFSTKWNLPVSEGTEHLDVKWALLNHAVKSELVSGIAVLDSASHKFIVNAELSNIEDSCTVLETLSENWYLVETQDLNVLLEKEFNSIEVADVSIEFSEYASTIDNFNWESKVEDPTSEDSQWHRLRVASRFRPLVSKFGTHEYARKSKPELYIMDTGINFDHQEFDYPELEKADFFTLEAFNGVYSDQTGHGTAVASMAVGKNLGIADHAKLMNVKIGGLVDGDFRSASIFEVGVAIDAILAEAATDPSKPRLVNMSWGTPRSPWLDSKVLSLIDAGISVVCAAGNSGVSVDDITPAGIPEVITVGATDKYDIPSGFNNIAPNDSGLVTATGGTLNLFAPGDGVTAAGFDQNDSYLVVAGTSFAAPIVSGIATAILSNRPVAMSYSKLRDTLLENATPDSLLFEDDKFLEEQNRLAYFIFADKLYDYKVSDSYAYLGVHDEDNDVLVGDLNSIVSSTQFISRMYSDLDEIEDPVYFIEFDENFKEYEQFLELDKDTGVVTINKPDLPLPEETKMKMVEFTVGIKNDFLRIESFKVFFFHTNPLYEETLESDITLALSEINSVSFMGVWFFFSPALYDMVPGLK